jgi:NAD(P)-dependent dehydrogenase (short-subunit alcohol dehydrogenase family)
MGGRFEGRVAVVTGGGRGLGRAHARALAADGATVVVNDLGVSLVGLGADDAPARQVVAEIEAAGGRALADTKDIASFAGGEALIERALTAFGRIDIVVNNAGITQQASIADLDPDVLHRHFAVHLESAIGTTRAAFAAMPATGGGSIINTVSGAGLKPEHPNNTAYACAKAAVYAFTKTAALEAPTGVRVNAVSPFAITRMSERFFAQDAEPDDDLDPARASVVVVFLASDLAHDVNGHIIRVMGGHLSEPSMQWSAGVTDAAWTPELIALNFASIVAVS